MGTAAEFHCRANIMLGQVCSDNPGTHILKPHVPPQRNAAHLKLATRRGAGLPNLSRGPAAGPGSSAHRHPLNSSVGASIGAYSANSSLSFGRRMGPLTALKLTLVRPQSWWLSSAGWEE